MWLGMYSDTSWTHMEQKNAFANKLFFVRQNGERVTGKREAQRLLQPYVDRVNSSLGYPAESASQQRLWFS